MAAEQVAAGLAALAVARYRLASRPHGDRGSARRRAPSSTTVGGSNATDHRPSRRSECRSRSIPWLPVGQRDRRRFGLDSAVSAADRYMAAGFTPTRTNPGSAGSRRQSIACKGLATSARSSSRIGQQRAARHRGTCEMPCFFTFTPPPRTSDSPASGSPHK